MGFRKNFCDTHKIKPIEFSWFFHNYQYEVDIFTAVKFVTYIKVP